MAPDDELEFEEWYGAERRQLVASLVLVTGDLHRARDAADEAFVPAYERWSRVGRMASPTGWTYRVALNVVRRTERRRSIEERLLRRKGPPRSDVDLPEPAVEAWRAVAALPPRQRLAIVLRYVGDLTESDIARAMGVRRSTVSRTIEAAASSLRAVLGEDAALVTSQEDSCGN